MNTENTETTENTTNPVSDHSENVTTENTVSDLPDADLPSMHSTATNDAGESTLVDLDNTAEDHIDQDSSNSTLQDATYSSATEEQTMELFPETPSSRPSAKGLQRSLKLLFLPANQLLLHSLLENHRVNTPQILMILLLQKTEHWPY